MQEQHRHSGGVSHLDILELDPKSGGSTNRTVGVMAWVSALELNACSFA
jgi:hypothetical protein